MRHAATVLRHDGRGVDDTAMGNPSSRPRQHRPSIKTVAALAGVSWSTVSNVINNHPSVRPETRAKVEEAIDILGYRPNVAGRSLRRGTANTVLLLSGPLTRSSDAALTDALITQCRHAGLTAMVETSGESATTLGHLLDHVRVHEWDAAVVVGQACERVRLPSSVTLPLGFVLPPTQPTQPCTIMGTDVGGEIGDLLDCATAHGAQRVCLAADDVCLDSVLPVFIEAMTARGLAAGAGAVLRTHGDDVAAGAHAADRVTLSSVDAVVCVSEQIASGMYARLRERVCATNSACEPTAEGGVAAIPAAVRSSGLAMPQVLSLRGMSASGAWWPGVPHTQVDMAAFATEAIECLTRPHPDRQTVVVPHTLITS